MPRRRTERTAAPTTMRQQIAAAISASGVSVYKLAKLTGISTQVLYRFLNGQRGIGYEALEKLIVELGLRLRADP